MAIAIGCSKVQARFEDPRGLLGDRLRGTYLLLAEHGGAICADDSFADLYKSARLGHLPTPAARHGPSIVWTRKVNAHTVTKGLSNDELDGYRAWLDNS